jgi:hypothetical protein
METLDSEEASNIASSDALTAHGFLRGAGVNARKAIAGTSCQLNTDRQLASSDFNLLGDLESVVDFDAEIPDR